MQDETFEYSEEEKQVIEFIVNARRLARNQILYGLGWWVASIIAIAFSISSPEASIIWFGGLLGAPFHWVRAYRLYSASREVGAGPLIKSELIGSLATVALVVTSLVVLAPEVGRVYVPGVGTCWSSNEETDRSTPVACWSGEAIAQTVALTSSADLCPSEATLYLEPENTTDPFTCLKELY